MSLIKWNSISSSSIDASSGLYAWYYDLTVGDYDVRRLIDYLEKDEEERLKLIKVQDFLDSQFFSFFRESNYRAQLKGKLMPSFEGELQHVEHCSESLVQNILDQPDCLWDIKRIISNISTEFSSPIYIGMSENLQFRVISHKQLIERFKVERIKHNNFESRDESFAARIVSRGMIETSLKVVVQYVPSEKNIHNLLENLLNRVNYPILGRN